MYKNQLQELAQRSCFNLPSYTCIREGPDHAPRFKASVNFNGEIFEAPSYCTTLRQAEHAAAEVALTALSTRGPSRFLASKVLDEIGVYKNLLQESVHRAGLNLPVYTTERSGPGHLPVFISIVELAGMNFTGESARTKKQAEKNAAMAAWSALKQLANVGSTSQTNNEIECTEEQEHVVVARVLSTFSPKGENKNLRQRDQNQVRKSMVSSYRDNYFGSSSKSLLQQHQWKNQQKGSLSTLSTPNPSTYSKILPPTFSTRVTQEQVRSNPQVRIQDIRPPLEEHQKDEDEWLYGKADIREKPSEKSSNSYSIFLPKPTHHRSYNQNCPSILMRTMPHGGIGPVSNTNTTIPSRNLNYGHGGIAPAVNIRSVIPVCAAPPTRPPSSNTPIAAAPQKKQDSSLVSDSAVVKDTEQEVPEASSKLKDLHISTVPIQKSCF